MSTETATDLEIICAALAEGRKIDAALAQRVREHSDQLRTTTRDQLSIDLLREVRDE